MATSKDQTAEELANWHFGVEPALERVIRIVTGNEDLPGEPIKLLEVNAATVETGSVEPFAFGATEAVPYAAIIAEVTPGEFERIQRRELPLPTGWSLDGARVFERPSAG